ncbi:hypothetical protein HaLaN_29768, partial [Haematococcus lacustris]
IAQLRILDEASCTLPQAAASHTSILAFIGCRIQLNCWPQQAQLPLSSRPNLYGSAASDEAIWALQSSGGCIIQLGCHPSQCSPAIGQPSLQACATGGRQLLPQPTWPLCSPRPLSAAAHSHAARQAWVLGSHPGNRPGSRLGSRPCSCWPRAAQQGAAHTSLCGPMLPALPGQLSHVLEVPGSARVFMEQDGHCCWAVGKPDHQQGADTKLSAAGGTAWAIHTHDVSDPQAAQPGQCQPRMQASIQ